MSDIRKRTGKKGTTYQVRYPSKATKSGYAYATFNTLKEARAFRDQQRATAHSGPLDHSIRTVPQAIDRWLAICEKEGTDGNEPVTEFTLKNYQYYATFMTAYEWPKSLQELQPPDIVVFRSWLLANCPSRYVARKTLTYFHTVMGEMALRGHTPVNLAAGISIKSDSRYDEPVVVPTKRDVMALLAAADRLANSKNIQMAKVWERYRPILYLAADSGMRPQEYLALSRGALLETGIHVDRAIERSGKKISVTKTPSGRRTVDISPDVLKMVRHYADHIATLNAFDLVFPTSTGRWQAPRNWRERGFYAACREAGLITLEEVKGELIAKPKYRPYDLRHFYASVLIEKKTNPKKLQKLMGHKNIETTLNVYGHLIEDVQDETTGATGILNQIAGSSCGKSVAGTT